MSIFCKQFRPLVEYPHIGRRRADLTSRSLRFQWVRDYLIAYAPEEKPLWVVAVIHGRRNPRVIAALLRDRVESAQWKEHPLVWLKRGNALQSLDDRSSFPQTFHSGLIARANTESVTISAVEVHPAD